ncbi:MAG: hypothetical protein EBZ69_00325 [Alphaproteobacteria bacterium]|nr:hypothetical protein [Alphaproteobacteria bacterium]
MSATRNWAAVYEEDDPSFSNIMGGPHYNVVDITEDEEVVATIWIDDDIKKCNRDALLIAAAPNLLLACADALAWAASQDETLAPRWIRRMAKAVRKARGGDKNTRTFYD